MLDFSHYSTKWRDYDNSVKSGKVFSPVYEIWKTQKT